MTREVGEAPDTFEFVVVGGGRNVAVGEKLYEAVFAPEFGADELNPPWFGDEGVVTLAALASDGTPAGGIAIWRYDCGVLLIGYIAVAPKWRRHHIASRLFEEAATRWWPPLDIGAPAHSSESAASPLVVLEVEGRDHVEDAVAKGARVRHLVEIRDSVDAVRRRSADTFLDALRPRFRKLWRSRLAAHPYPSVAASAPAS